MITGPSETLARGEILTFPSYQLRITSLEFERNSAFPGAVAQVAIESGRGHTIGDHLETPFGVVQIAEDDRGFVEDDEEY